MKKSKFSEIIIYLLVFFNFIIFLNLGKISNFFSDLYFYFYIVSAIILFIITISSNNFMIPKKVVLLLLVSFAIGLFCFYINQISFGNMIIVNGTILYIFVFSNQKFDNRFYKGLLIMFVSLALFQTFKASGSAKYYLNNDAYLNPNTIAQLLLYCLVYINFIWKKYGYSKKLLFFLNLIIFYGIYKSECRNVLIVGALYVVILNFINTKILKNKNLIKIAYIITIVAGIVLPIVLVSMYNKGINIQIPFSSKSLYSGRELLWKVILNKFSSYRNIFIGIPITTYLNDVYMLNFHNIFLTVLINYGGILFVIYFYYLYKNIISKTTNDINVYVKWGIICVLMAGIFENIIMTCTFSIFFSLIYSFLNEEFLVQKVKISKNKKLRKW